MHIQFKELLSIFVVLESFWIFVKAEYSSALVDLESLLKTDVEIINALDTYLKLEEKRLEKINRYKDEYDELYKTAKRDLKAFLSNPVNAYLLVKRLSKDWKKVVSLMSLSSSKDVVVNVTQKEIFPNSKDLGECIEVLLRLQDTYLLNTTQLSKGEITEMRGASELTASDCIVLGLRAFAQQDYSLALLWMQEALDRKELDENEFKQKMKLLELMAFSAYSLGNLKHALKLTKDLLEVRKLKILYLLPNSLLKAEPDHPHAQQNLAFYEKAFIEKSDEDKIKVAGDETEKKAKIDQKNVILEDDADFFDFERYKKLCRGDHLKSPAEESKLSCRYTTSNSKYFLLQPIKEEVLNLDPKIVFYHDVIRDSDIELLKELSTPLLERAPIFNPVTGVAEYTSDRISKNCWLGDQVHPRVRHISFMIEEITGLEIDTAEELQINKYGLGGHYAGHYDFRRDGEADPFARFGAGNRIATWMFYLSDVDVGGSTVFPRIDVHAKPKKGSAVFWYNLLKNGKGDFRTNHAACPVLSGTKWVANKWFHEKGQEFRRPCSLNPLE